MRQTMVDAFRNARFFHYFRIHEKLNETPEKPTFEKRRRKSLRIRLLWHRESGTAQALRVACGPGLPPRRRTSPASLRADLDAVEGRGGKHRTSPPRLTPAGARCGGDEASLNTRG